MLDTRDVYKANKYSYFYSHCIIETSICTYSHWSLQVRKTHKLIHSLSSCNRSLIILSSLLYFFVNTNSSLQSADTNFHSYLLLLISLDLILDRTHTLKFPAFQNLCSFWIYINFIKSFLNLCEHLLMLNNNTNPTGPVNQIA